MDLICCNRQTYRLLTINVSLQIRSIQDENLSFKLDFM